MLMTNDNTVTVLTEILEVYCGNQMFKNKVLCCHCICQPCSQLHFYFNSSEDSFIDSDEDARQ